MEIYLLEGVNKTFYIMDGYMNGSHISDYMNVLVLILDCHQCQRGRLLILNGCISNFSIMSNLLTIAEMISYPLFDR